MATFDTMEFVDLEEMLDEVSPDELAGCPAELVKKHLRKAAIRFCRESQWFRATLDPVTLLADVTVYELDMLPDDVKLSSIVWMKMEDRLMDGSEYSITDDGRGIELVSAPAARVINGLEARVVLEPVAGFQTLEKQLVERWGACIGALAKSTLKMIPGKSWTDRQGALLAMQEVQAGLGDARNEAVRERKNGDLKTVRKVFAV